MFFKNHVRQEPIYEKKQVEVWQCPDCIGWMQKEFALSQQPSCPFCATSMLEGIKEINVLM